MKLRLLEQSMGDLCEEAKQYAAQGEAAAKQLRKTRTDMAWRDLPYTQEHVVADILQTANRIRETFDAFVVLGIGGSALGPIAVQQALNHPRYNELPSSQRGPRFYVEDNIDPERMQALLDVIDSKRTCFNVVSKSGNTSETIAQFLVLAERIHKAGGSVKEQVIFTTGENDGYCNRVAKQEGAKRFVVPEGVGGRFSELCPVGLLPAAVCGIDIRALLEGAATVDRYIEMQDANMVYWDGLLQYAAMQRGLTISVMMPYCDALKYIADWYAQLWAESLGKRFNREGHEVFTGQTPVRALGATDQHSQIQLYTEGPRDKVITFLAVDSYRNTIPIPHLYAFDEYVSGHTMEEVLVAEQKATAYALTQVGRPNKTILLPEVNADTLGQLLYWLEMETAFVGELLHINAFDQPGVEAGKAATRQILAQK